MPIGIRQYVLTCIAVVSCLFVVPIDIAAAAGTDFGLQNVAESGISLGNTNIILIITQIIRVVLGLLGIIVVGLFLYAGYLWMTSAGAEDKIAKAKSTMINATIGLAIIMSAFAIVQFIITALSDATGAPGAGGGGNGSVPTEFSFVGSGALGEAILDHYPFRNAQDIPRNTKISITFRENINPATIIANSNNTCFGSDDTIVLCSTLNEADQVPVYGDCLTPAPGVPFNWQRDCDALVTSSIQIFELENDPERESLISGAVIATYEDTSNTQLRTITIRPYEPLGSSVDKIWYRVALSNNIQNIEGASIFRSSRSPYMWDFQTDTILDLSPPVVQSVYPAAGEEISKNTIVSITFNEAMDPVVVQGVINSTENPFTNIIFGNTNIPGQWRIANGYRTVEFIPATPCDEVNSCGELMYCLPVGDCTPADETCRENYQTLIRTARRISDETWESVPFSGVYDMSGNALDGNADGIKNPFPPRPIQLRTLGTDEIVPDNYSWSFRVQNTIDRRIPYPYQITPGVDAEQVRGTLPITILFNMPMFVGTLYDIDIEEFPTTEYEEPWTYPIASIDSIPPTVFGNTTSVSKVVVQHREFGPDNKDLFYFTTIAGGVRGVNQNCMYPGVGPAGVSGVVNTSCIVAADGKRTGCTDVTTVANNDTSCAFNPLTTSGNDQSLADTEACLTILRQDSDLTP